MKFNLNNEFDGLNCYCNSAHDNYLARHVEIMNLDQ